MRTFWHVSLPLLVSLGLLAWGASIAVDAATKAWFLRDLTLRAHLVAAAARATLSTHLASGERKKLLSTVESLARDERITAAEVCGPGLTTVVATRSFPARFSCEALRASRTRRPATSSAASQRWTTCCGR
jgi:trehalose 6-phosphate synthase